MAEDEAAFEQALPALVRTMRIIVGAMCTGLLMFAGLTSYFYLHAQGKTPAPDSLLMILSAVHAFVFVSSYTMGAFLAGAQLKTSPLEPAERAAEARLTEEEQRRIEQARAEAGITAREIAVSRIQTSEIILWATREGPALLGLVICFLAASSGAAAAKPGWLLNGLSTVVFWALAANTFPSEERYRELYRTKLLGR